MTSVLLAAAGAVAVGYALRIFHSDRVERHAGRPRHFSVLFVAAGMLLSGVSAIAGGIARAVAPDVLFPDVPLPAELPLVGLFLAVGTYLLGLLLMPAPAATFVGRVRRTLDGIGIGICTFFVAWLLIFAELGLRGGSLTAVLLACVAISAAVIGTVRAMRFNRAAAYCGAGVVASIVGLTGLIVALDYAAPFGWVLTGAVPLVGGSMFAWYGIRVARGTQLPRQAADDGSFADYPLLALPLGGGLVAATYHFVVYRELDQVSIVLGIVGVTVVAVRETLAVTDVRRYAQRLAVREEHFRSLVVGSTDVALMLDGKLVVLWQSPAAARQFGLSDQDVVGRALTALVHPDDAVAVAACFAAVLADAPAPATVVEARLRDGFGEWRDTEWSVSDQRTASAVGALVVHVRDIGERKELERTLRRTAFVDQLTGLPNRREFRRELTGRPEGVVIVLGLGGLHRVNHVHGHEVGDAVLVEAARRLRAGLPGGDVPARLDGDEFAAVTEAGAVQAQLLATRLLTVLTEPYQVSGVTAHLTPSAGLAELGPVEGGRVNGDEALRRAGLALQQARRQSPGGGAEWYDEATEAVLRRRLTIEQELPGAAARGELDLAYQPVLALPEQRPVGAEALLCWRHPGLGTVTAAEFVPVAEELGVLDEIGGWLLNQALGRCSVWLGDGWDLWMSINVTAGQLADTAFVAALTGALESHAVPASRLVVEFGLDEGPDPTADARAHALATNLTELRTLGVRAALDGFGTGATSLRRLRILPLDVLKLDRAMFAEPGGPAVAIVAAVVNLAQQIGVTVAATGLESAPDLAAAEAAGCRYVQGDLLCRPVLAEHVEAYLDSHRSTRSAR
jgi:diguanylate cyclase (GGDEF)-like protein/PAS domain S-box-containing protein